MPDHKRVLHKVDKLVQEIHRQAEAQKKLAAEMRKLAAVEKESSQSLLRDSRGLRKAAADYGRV